MGSARGASINATPHPTGTELGAGAGAQGAPLLLRASSEPVICGAKSKRLCAAQDAAF